MKRLCCLILFVLIGSPCLVAQTAHEHHGHDMPAVDENSDPQKLLADKRESEFNHHLAGFLVALGGVVMLLPSALGKQWVVARYVWPISFLLSGAFVLVFSDTELWPFGTRQWLEALQNNPEVLQHKTFALGLLGLGWIEWLRLGNPVRLAWSGFVFPCLAIGGSILLLFHQHEGGMHGPNHMELMERIQYQHLSYAVVGIGIGVAKALAELKVSGERIFANVWPLLMATLGVLLMFYRE